MNELETLIVLQARTALLTCQTVDYVEIDADPMPTSTLDKKAIAAAIESIDLMLLSAGQAEPAAWVNSSNLISFQIDRERCPGGGGGDLATTRYAQSDYHNTPLFRHPHIAQPVQLDAPSNDEDALNARRYRLLRKQHWYSSTLFVACGKENLDVGTYCPSEELLDEAIDALLQIEFLSQNTGGTKL